MPKLVNCDQTGFIKSRLAAVCFISLMLLVSVIHRCHSSLLTQWKPLIAWNGLCYGQFRRRWALVPLSLEWFKFCILIPLQECSTFSSLFSVSRSSHQSCPLSPALFVLSEPLAQAIHLSNMVSPIGIRNIQHHLSLFEDDVLMMMCVFLETPSRSLPHLLSICEEYGSLSGFKINWSKSAWLRWNEKNQGCPLIFP